MTDDTITDALKAQHSLMQKQEDRMRLSRGFETHTGKQRDFFQLTVICANAIDKAFIIRAKKELAEEDKQIIKPMMETALMAINNLDLDSRTDYNNLWSLCHTANNIALIFPGYLEVDGYDAAWRNCHFAFFSGYRQEALDEYQRVVSQWHGYSMPLPLRECQAQNFSNAIKNTARRLN